MNSAPITRGTTDGGTMVAVGALFFVSAFVHLWWGFTEAKWLPGILGLGFLGWSVQYLRRWASFRRGRWKIEWDGSQVRIWDGDQVDYAGEVGAMHRVEQDGRGYFLYPTKETAFRLRRGRSSEAFEALLDRVQARVQE